MIHRHRFLKRVRLGFESLETRHLLTLLSYVSDTISQERDTVATIELEVADFDRDGDLDVVSLNNGPGINAIHLHENRKDGRFSKSVRLTETREQARHLTIAEGDQPTVAWLGGSGEDSTIHVGILRHGNDQVSFTTARSRIDVSPEISHINEDPDSSVVYGDIRQRGSNTFNIAEKEAATRIDDFDGDGHLDAISYVDPAGGGKFEVQVNSNLADSGSRPTTVATLDNEWNDFVVADFDGDSDADVVSTTVMGNGTVISFLKSDRITLHPHWSQVVASRLDRLKIVDADMDGDSDIVAEDLELAGQIWWLENTGQTFLAPTVFTKIVIPHNDFELADINADGMIDVVVAANELGVIYYSRDAPNDPLRYVTDPGNAPKTQLHATDLDRDGNVDIISSSIRADAIMLRLGFGDGTFSAPIRITGNVKNVIGLEIADIDNDGDSDFVVTRSDTGRVSWLENETVDREFIRHDLGNPQFKPAPAIVGDVDNDGDQDIVTPISGRSELTWFRNDGGLFSAEIIPFDNAINSAALMDGDLDGNLDLIVDIGDERSEIMMYRNERAFEEFTPFRIASSSGRRVTMLDTGMDSSVLIVHEVYALAGESRLRPLSAYDLANPERIRRVERFGLNSYTPPSIAIMNPLPILSEHILFDGQAGLVAFFPDSLSRPESKPTAAVLSELPTDSTAAADFDNDGKIDFVSAAGTSLHVFLSANTIPGDFNRDSKRDVRDLDELCMAQSFGALLDDDRFDFDGSGDVTSEDYKKYRELVFGSPLGDANLDGVFDSSDLVAVFQSNAYETGRIATWSEGDWNCDRRFDSRDLVAAFNQGGYVREVQSAVQARLVATELQDVIT